MCMDCELPRDPESQHDSNVCIFLALLDGRAQRIAMGLQELM